MLRRTNTDAHSRHIYSLAGVLTILVVTDNPDPVVIACVADEIICQTKTTLGLDLKSHEEVINWAMNQTRNGLNTKYQKTSPTRPVVTGVAGKLFGAMHIIVPLLSLLVLSLSWVYFHHIHSSNNH